MGQQLRPSSDGPINELEAGLGFRIEILPNGQMGHVVMFPGTAGRTEVAVRPATGVEIALWKVLIISTAPNGVRADDVSDPFGTPKSEERQ